LREKGAEKSGDVEKEGGNEKMIVTEAPKRSETIYTRENNLKDVKTFWTPSKGKSIGYKGSVTPSRSEGDWEKTQ